MRIGMLRLNIRRTALARRTRSVIPAVQPGHVLRGIIPDTHGQDHPSPQGLTHAHQPARSGFRSAIVDRPAVNRPPSLDILPRHLGQPAPAGRELRHDGKHLIRIDRFPRSIKPALSA